MFQRFHDAKTQETDIIQENGSRSSTPGTAIDGRTMYTCNVSPMAAHDSLVNPYSTSISPSQSIISQNTQITCEDSQLMHNPKYIATSPPEAHRYVVQVCRSPNDIPDSSKYIDDSGRMSIDVFRESQVDPQRVPLEIQRIRLEDHPDSYRRSTENYHPVDLQRVPDYSIEQVNVDQQRLESEISRLHSELVRSGGDPRLLQQEEIDINGFQNTHTLDYRIVTEDVCRDSPPRIIQETLRGNHSDPQRLVQESILKDYCNYNTTRHSEVLRIAADPRIASENIRYASPENIRVHRFDMDINSQSAILSENLRLADDTARSIISENLRVTPDGSSMVPENLCITDPHVIPENLHIGNDGINGLSPNANGDSHIVTQSMPIDSPMNVRTHYEAHLNSDQPHSYREIIRVQSPQYTDTYRNNLYNGTIPTAPPTPAPSVPPMPETSSTPISSRYYSGDSYISTTPHSSHSIVYANQFNSYSNDMPEDKDFRQVLTIEERIERGYQDIKPFDQDYPVSLPVMHLTQEPLPPPSIPKLSKPKKPKEAKPLRTPIIHKCIECDRNFKNSTQLKNHMWRHTGEKPFTCEECGSKFTQQGNLRAHRRIHTGERPYQCSDCKACFTQLSTLKTHQKIHSNERPYKCNHCDAAFRQIANLKTHQVTHTGERPHQCDQCDKAFTQKSNLKAHKNRVHSSNGTNGPHRRGRRKAPAAIRPYSCLECSAQFTILSNLKSHMKLHSGEKCFECDFCGAGFTQRSNLKTHMQRMHGRGVGQGRRRVRCDECPAMFRLKRCLKTHKKKRHPIKSLKIKLLRESNYSSESVGHSDELSDEYGSDDDTLDGDDYSDSEDINFDLKMEQDLKRKLNCPDDKRTVYDRSPTCKVEPEPESQFEYPGSPVTNMQKEIHNFPEEAILENCKINDKDNQKTSC